ncbi:EamA family transporter RarD [Dactylosporangium sp. AC04546]|uniref:EamA family transporter RarD n=1 Tax=Dactylosporangium sp. AC04546 TaxID=2862460 RepID=UPI001EDE89A9|nr:EamA family transporter RarD [Dactylosporangium sp. AC04546]WVK84071.1 EamA family transporter RarD [Dactylosporangium sp. AC04546]
MDPLRRGYLSALTANVLWGVFPLYFRALRPAGAVEVLAHRIVWSLVTVALLLTALWRWRPLKAILSDGKRMAGISAAAVFIAVNWGVYIYAVDTNRVVEASLGYFVNPLVVILLGVLVLRERLRRLQWIALGVGAVAVVVLTIDYGHLPWVALTLAGSFGGYGLFKKQLGLPAAEGLILESAVLTLPAVVYLGWLTNDGTSTFGTVSTWHTIMLAGSGLLTAVPLLLFAEAANRVPLSGLGILQYLTPTLQLILGVAVFHEALPPGRLVGFVIVWCALSIFTWDAIRSTRRTRAAQREEAAAVVSTATAPTR